MQIIKLVRSIALGVKASTIRHLSTTPYLNDKHNCKVLVIGGGTGGCAIAAKLCRSLGSDKVIILDSADKHYYQPMFTMIGGGMKTVKDSYRSMESVLPSKAKWIKDEAVEIDPNDNEVKTKKGDKIKYDYLVVATGLQLDYDKIPGLVEALSDDNSMVSSIYSPKYVDQVYKSLKTFEKGNAIFTFPASPVKCPGAPQKICYITDEYFRKTGKRNNATIIYNTSLPVIFGVKYFADALWKVVDERDIKVNLKTNLVEVQPDKKTAIFVNMDEPTKRIPVEYGMLHVAPPQSTPEVLKRCKELTNEAGFVTVDKSTMQHEKYPNVFAIGDCSSSPNSKTAAAAAAQSEVVHKNLMAVINGKELKQSYNGYASCPLVTGYSKCILAEFDYDLNPVETFPFAQNKERWTMFVMKKDFMPPLYWHLMLKGLWNGPEPLRKLMAPFKFS